MKKTMMFLGVLSLGLAQAQQEFEGKVGVNTDTPSATLNVKSKTGTTQTTKNFESRNADNKQLFTIMDNGKVGLNRDPQYLLDILSIGDGYLDNSIALNAYRDNDGGFGLDFYRARGTDKAPISVKKQDRAGSINFAPYNGKFIQTASIGATVTGDISADKIPLSLDFRVHYKGDNVHSTVDNLVMRVHHSGNLGVGILDPTHKVHIRPEIGSDPLKLEGLQETTDANAKNLVVVDGVVKVGSAVSDANVKLGTGTSKPCNSTNAGTINYEEITREGKKTGVFGFCMKRNDNEYVWAYMVGGTNPFGTSANGANFADGIKD